MINREKAAAVAQRARQWFHSDDCKEWILYAFTFGLCFEWAYVLSQWAPIVGGWINELTGN